MADQLATPEDLASLLQLDYDTLSVAQKATMVMLIELATGKVQRAAGGQRIVEVTDTAVIDVRIEDEDEYLALPQMPIQSVEAVVLNGTPITDWMLSSQQLWRMYGWSPLWTRPSQVKVTYTHGLPTDSQWLQGARDTTLSLARIGFDNPTGASSEGIDDYRITYAAADARMQMTPQMEASIAAAYGASAYVTSSR